MRNILKTTLISVILWSLLISFADHLTPCRAESPAVLLSAYATSATEDSLPVTDLLNLTKEGRWQPKSNDSGVNEGLYFEFESPVLIDWIKLTVQGGLKGWDCTYYLDGMRMVAADDTDIQSGQAEYASDYQIVGKNLILTLGIKGDINNGLAPLNTTVKSVFIKIMKANPGAKVVSVRFYRRDSKKALPIQVPGYVKAKATATSTLSPVTAYQVSNLFDSKIDFAWSTNGNQSNGTGESFTISLNKPLDLSGLLVWNGYQRSDTHFYANSRPWELKVKINGTTEFGLSLMDTMECQLLKFPKTEMQVKTMTVTILDVYPGEKYKDTLISELKLVDHTGKAIVLDVPSQKIIVNIPNLARMLDTTLEPFMLGLTNSDTYDFWMDSQGYVPRSIRFRSNGSFVGYTRQGIIEGNWEPISSGIRIFGKKYSTKPLDSIYLREGENNNPVDAEIFQANIDLIDLSKIPWNEAKKYYKPILADRYFYNRIDKDNSAKIVWWMGIQPHENAYITGKNEDELIKKAYDIAVKQKAFLLRSSLFTDLFLPGDNIIQTYGASI